MTPFIAPEETPVCVVPDLCQKIATGILARLPGIGMAGLGSAGVMRGRSLGKKSALLSGERFVSITELWQNRGSRRFEI
jgi:hypothetical protein